MIKNITASGKYVQVSGGSGSTYVGNNSGAQGVGNLRYNTVTQNIEIYDGFTWVVMNTGYPSIGLTGEAESLLDWARKKRDEEFERDRLAQSNPAIKDLLNQVKEKEDQIKMVMTLLKSPGHEEVQTSP
jgi:hypothetical protein